MDNKVILPTLMKSTYVDNDDPNNFEVIHEYNKYEFTIEDALKYLADSRRYYLFSKMILQNVNLRNELRKLGAKVLVDRLSLFMASPDKRIEEEMDKFVKTWTNKQLGDIDIQVWPLDRPFTVDGVEFEDFDELSSSVETTFRYSPYSDVHPYSVKPSVTPKCFVAEVWEPYPRFDIYDSCDDRTYQNYLIREHTISEEEIRSVGRLGRMNFCAVREDTPAELLPLVYYEGDGGFMLVANKHKD